MATSPEGQSGRTVLPGLSPDARYRLRVRTELGLPSFHQVAAPPWPTAAQEGRLALPGSVPAVAGLPMPALDPGQALLIEVRRVD